MYSLDMSANFDLKFRGSLTQEELHASTEDDKDSSGKLSCVLELILYSFLQQL